MNTNPDARLQIQRQAGAWGRLIAPLQAWWQTLGDREQRLVAAGALLVGGALLWLLALKPPIALLREAPGRLDALDAQTQSMQRLAAEVRELRTASTVSASQSIAALKAASERLGSSAKLSVQGERAVLTVEGVDGESLRAWLAEVRSGARARAVEAQLSRSPKGFSGSITLAIGAPA